jgi:hypothetical protein
MTLFERLPRSKRVEITQHRLKALDVIAYLDGKPLYGSAYSIRTAMLRRLMREGLILVTRHSPACYRLTQLGDLLRGNRR